MTKLVSNRNAVVSKLCFKVELGVFMVRIEPI